MYGPLYVLLCVLFQYKYNSYSKNKFQKIVLLVGLIIRTYHNAQSSLCEV